jgi:hypothetical protein
VRRTCGQRSTRGKAVTEHSSASWTRKRVKTDVTETQRDERTKRCALRMKYCQLELRIRSYALGGCKQNTRASESKDSPCDTRQLTNAICEVSREGHRVPGINPSRGDQLQCGLHSTPCIERHTGLGNCLPVSQVALDFLSRASPFYGTSWYTSVSLKRWESASDHHSSSQAPPTQATCSTA